MAGDDHNGTGGADVLLRAEGISRSFGVTRALDDATLLVRPGEIHSLAGENGSGKSTLIKILSGVIGPDAGELVWHGRPVRFRGPAAAQRAGIATVFQETLVVLEQTVLENIFIGTDGIFRRGRSGDAETELGRRTLEQLGLPIALDRPAWTLSLAERQLVTIARALVRPWDVLLLDEASSALDAEQRDRLFAFLREQRDEGKAILFTSHRMDELRQLADTVSVLRLGRTVARLPVAQASVELILGHMAGRAGADDRSGRSERTPSAARPASSAADGVLRCEELVLRPGPSELLARGVARRDPGRRRSRGARPGGARAGCSAAWPGLRVDGSRWSTSRDAPTRSGAPATPCTRASPTCRATESTRGSSSPSRSRTTSAWRSCARSSVRASCAAARCARCTATTRPASASRRAGPTTRSARSAAGTSRRSCSRGGSPPSRPSWC